MSLGFERIVRRSDLVRRQLANGIQVEPADLNLLEHWGLAIPLSKTIQFGASAGECQLGHPRFLEPLYAPRRALQALSKKSVDLADWIEHGNLAALGEWRAHDDSRQWRGLDGFVHECSYYQDEAERAIEILELTVVRANALANNSDGLREKWAKTFSLQRARLGPLRDVEEQLWVVRACLDQLWDAEKRQVRDHAIWKRVNRVKGRPKGLNLDEPGGKQKGRQIVARFQDYMSKQMVDFGGESRGGHAHAMMNRLADIWSAPPEALRAFFAMRVASSQQAKPT